MLDSTIPIVHALLSYNEEVWTEGHQQSEAAGNREGLKEGHTLRGEAKKHFSVWEGEDLEKQKARLPPGEEVTRSVCALPFKNGPLFEANRSLKQNEVFNGVIVCVPGREFRFLAPQARQRLFLNLNELIL